MSLFFFFLKATFLGLKFTSRDALSPLNVVLFENRSYFGENQVEIGRNCSDFYTGNAQSLNRLARA